MSEATRSMEEIVAKFLRQNPDFLEREPALLKDLELSHASGPAVSLIEKQVHYFDERLSSHAADELLLQTDLTRKQKKSLHDAIAAQVILQDFLDSQT